MELFVHFGLYKTGSSFLQTTCARIRPYLLSNSIYFPESFREKDMLAGKISPGNGNNLSKYLRRNEIDQVLKTLNDWIKEAESLSCSKILISDESLIHAFVVDDALKKFHDCTIRLGIKSVSCFGLFRDPIDHCLSTFKHRAKKGQIPSFEYWVNNEYETMQRVREFLFVYDSVPFKWFFRKYHKNSELIFQYFFYDWLNCSFYKNRNDIWVNPSLTLSEITIIQQAGLIDLRLSQYLYSFFLNIPPDQKEKDISIENRYKIIAFSALSKYRDLFEFLNHVLENMGSETLHFELDSGFDTHNEAIQLNTIQINAFFYAIKHASKLHVRIKDSLKSIIRKVIVFLK